MKVLCVLPAYEPAWAFGGVVRCTSNLCRAMAGEGADVSVYATNVDGRGGVIDAPVEQPAEVGGVTVTYFPSTWGGKSVWDSRSLVRTLDQTVSDFDIAYVSAIWQWLGISVGNLARKHVIPYVVGTHGSFDSVSLENAKIKKMLYWHLFLKKCIKHTSALHFTTEYERRQAVLLQSKYPSFIVPNCMQPEAFETDESLGKRIREEFHILPDAPVLITVGRPDPNKRLDVLLESLLLVVQHFPRARLMIVGPHENEHALEMKTLSSRMELSEKVIWTGYRSGDDLKGCYAAADLFLLASMGENFGMAVTEAMAISLPVIISNRVGVAEDVKRHSAGIVTDVSAQQVARAVVDLLRDRPRLQEMRRNARKAAQHLYRGERVAGMMLKAFEDVLSQSPSPEGAWQ